jgi:hypothetical protein
MNIDMPRDWPQQIQIIVSYLSYREAEAPDLLKARLVLQQVWDSIGGSFGLEDS